MTNNGGTQTDIKCPAHWITEGNICHSFDIAPELGVITVAYPNAALTFLAAELQNVINAMSASIPLTPVENAAIGNLGTTLVYRIYSIMFQRSRWCKNYYFPALVAAAPAQHPVFRVQNGTKIPFWSIQLFDGFGLRLSYEHRRRTVYVLDHANSYVPNVADLFYGQDPIICALCSKLHLPLVEYTRMQSSLATSNFFTLTVAQPITAAAARDAHTENQCIYDFDSDTSSLTTQIVAAVFSPRLHHAPAGHDITIINGDTSVATVNIDIANDAAANITIAGAATIRATATLNALHVRTLSQRVSEESCVLRLNNVSITECLLSLFGHYVGPSSMPKAAETDQPKVPSGEPPTHAAT